MITFSVCVKCRDISSRQCLGFDIVFIQSRRSEIMFTLIASSDCECISFSKINKCLYFVGHVSFHASQNHVSFHASQNLGQVRGAGLDSLTSRTVLKSNEERQRKISQATGSELERYHQTFFTPNHCMCLLCS